MRKTLTILLIVMSVFGVISIITSDVKDVNIIFNVSLIFIICILEITKDLLKNTNSILTVLQSVIIIGGIIGGFRGFEYIVPIILFQIIGEKVGILIFIGIGMSISVLFIKGNYFDIALYNVLVSLYIFEIKRQDNNNNELRDNNRDQRYEKFIMQKKISNLERYLEQNNQVASLKERNFMAQKLHDHLGHRITSSIMQLEVTKETLGVDNDLSNQYLLSAMENLRTGMDEIREVLRNVKPKDTMMGVEEIKEEILKFQYNTGIKVTLKVHGESEKIKLNIWIIFADNIREALTNAAKYSCGTEIGINIYIYNKIARVEIRDDGKGCTKIEKGLGLQGIEDRISAIGGRVEFYNDKGFVMNMIINLGE